MATSQTPDPLGPWADHSRCRAVAARRLPPAFPFETPVNIGYVAGSNTPFFLLWLRLLQGQHVFPAISTQKEFLSDALGEIGHFPLQNKHSHSVLETFAKSRTSLRAPSGPGRESPGLRASMRAARAG
eukprot:407500-Pyramimonas_sp.AAC.2